MFAKITLLQQDIASLNVVGGNVHVGDEPGVVEVLQQREER